MTKDKNNNQQEFDLGTILTVTTAKCRLFTEIENLYAILSYLIEDNTFTHQIPRAHEIAKSYVLLQYPNLEGVGDDVIIENREDVTNFLNEQMKIYGDKFILSLIPKGYSYIETASSMNDTPKSKSKK